MIMSRAKDESKRKSYVPIQHENETGVSIVQQSMSIIFKVTLWETCCIFNSQLKKAIDLFSNSMWLNTVLIQTVILENA